MLAFGLLLAAAGASTFDPSAAADLKADNAVIARETFKGVRSLRVAPATSDRNHSALVALPLPPFHDGSIDLELAGEVASGADAGARGFVGVVFRLQADNRYECFYLRPTNGRADDQLRRNHSLQYVSEPDYPWERLRQESPGVYESYADLEPGAWTRVRIEVAGVKARLYVNGAAQPALIVNDLKHGESSGAIGLWVGPGSIGHFSTLRVAGSATEGASAGAAR